MRPRIAFLAAAVLLVTGLLARAEARGAFPPLTEDGRPNVQSAGSLVVDAESGAVLYEKNPDEVRYIASTTKIFVAMVVREHDIDLDGVTEITEVDKDYARGGARTRLWVGHAFENIDLLRAMLIASDNRAPSALGRAVGLDGDELIAEMNRLAEDLGLEDTEFTDPSGLNGNKSTAREMVIALKAAMSDPLIAEIMATKTAEVVSIHDRPRRIHYRNTNRALHSDRHEVIGGKTGYTTPALYCLVIAARIDGREVYMALLGSYGELTRYGDFNRVAAWMKNGGAPEVNTANLAPAALSAGEL